MQPANILNGAFRLRTVHGKITTVGRPDKGQNGGVDQVVG